MEKISRREAHARALVHFYTGIPCKYGHLAKRYVTNGACSDCVNWARAPLSAPNIVKIPDLIFDVPSMTEDDRQAIRNLIAAWAPAALAEVQKKNAERRVRVIKTEIMLLERKLGFPEGDEDHCDEPWRTQNIERLAKLKAELLAC